MLRGCTASVQPRYCALARTEGLDSHEAFLLFSSQMRESLLGIGPLSPRLTDLMLERLLVVCLGGLETGEQLLIFLPTNGLVYSHLPVNFEKFSNLLES